MSVIDIFSGISSICFSVVFTLIAGRVWKMPNMISDSLDIHTKKIEKKIDFLIDEINLANKRVDVHDRISSNIIRHEFDSRAIIKSGDFPEMKKEL